MNSNLWMKVVSEDEEVPKEVKYVGAFETNANKTHCQESVSAIIVSKLTSDNKLLYFFFKIFLE